MKQADVPWDEISNTQKDIIRKKAEIESIADRIVQLEKDNDSYDDLHKARMKLKHVKDTWMDLEVKVVEQNVDLIKLGLIASLPNG